MLLESIPSIISKTFESVLIESKSAHFKFTVGWGGKSQLTLLFTPRLRADAYFGGGVNLLVVQLNSVH